MRKGKRQAGMATAAGPALAPGPRETPRSRGLSIVDMERLVVAATQRSQQTRRTPENNPFRLPAFPEIAMPRDPTKRMAQDTALVSTLSGFANDWLAGGMIFGEGLLFPGYAYLSELAQRAEYRILAEIRPKEATRKWIRFHATGDARQAETEKGEEVAEGKEPPPGGPDDEPDDDTSPEREEDASSGQAHDILPSEERERDRMRELAGPPMPQQGPMQQVDPIAEAVATGEVDHVKINREGGGEQEEGGGPSERAQNNSDKTEKIKELEDFLERINARRCFADLGMQDELFGRGHLYLDFGDADDSELLIPIGDGKDDYSRSKVSPGHPLKGLRTVEPVWTYPQVYNAQNPLLPDWYNPQQWFVMGKHIHATRLLKMVSRPVPDMLKPAYAFGGISMSQLAEPYVNIWLKTRTSIGELIHAFSVMVLSTDLSQTVMPGGPGDWAGSSSQGLLARLALFNSGRDNMGTYAINKDTEEFSNVSVPLSGLSDLQAQSMEHMAFVGQYPLVKFSGLQPMGLNASSEGEIRTFYDNISAYQNKVMRPLLETVIGFSMLSLWGEVDDEITWDFVSLWELSEKEKSEKQKSDADRDQIYIDSGVLSPAEVRDAIVNDPELPYVGLDPSNVPELKQEEMEGLIPKGAGKGIESVLGEGEGEENGGGGGGGGHEQPPHPNLPKGEEAGEDASIVPFDDQRVPDHHRVAKTRAEYRPEPNGDEKCSLCSMFVSPDQCETVDGKIAPEGWCKYWSGLIAKDAEWNESDHPRRDDGKFGTGGGGGGESAGKRGEGGSPHAQEWAEEGSAKGLSSTFDPKKHGDPTVYHGLKEGYQRKGFAFVTRSPEGAAFHGNVQAYKIKPGAQIHADLEEGRGKNGEQTLLGAKQDDSSGIIHFDDLIPSNAPPAPSPNLSVTSTPTATQQKQIGESIKKLHARLKALEDAGGQPEDKEYGAISFILTTAERDRSLPLSQRRNWRFSYAQDPSGNVVGAGAIRRIEGNTAEVAYLGSIQSGAGQSALTELEKRAREMGATKLQLESSPGAASFYRRNGWNAVGGSEEMPLFEKDLTAKARDEAPDDEQFLSAGSLATDAEWNESDHPRGQPENAGQFGPGGGHGGGSTKAKGGSPPSSGSTGTSASGQAPESFKTKKDLIGHLLTNGTTPADVLKATGWPSVSMPAAAKAARMILTREKVEGKTIYRGRPMTVDEEAAAFPPRVRKAIAGGRGPAGRNPETFSLVEFLAARGGIKADDPMVPDLQAIIGRKNLFVPGFGQLIRPTGNSLDRARESAVEGTYLYDQGFFTAEQQTSTVKTLLDAIDEEMRGNKRYRQGYEPPDVDEKQIEKELNSALKKAGIDSASIKGGIRSRIQQMMRWEGYADPIEAYETAVMEQTQRRADDGDAERIDESIHDWDVADDGGSAPEAGEPLEEIPF